MDLARHASGIGALADPVRRSLYDYVVAQPEPVGREQAAEALGLPRHTAKFHLDRLVDEGLLVTVFRRLSGKTGPGAGRPSKLYRRGDRELSVSLPARRYDLMGHLLAEAVDRVRLDGLPMERALEGAADAEGRRVAGMVPPTSAGYGVDRLTPVLQAQGYEPRVEDGEVVLSNCPFHTLAQTHTELVCGLNRSFVQGMADGLGVPARACLAPAPGRCCVRIRREEAPPCPDAPPHSDD